MSFNTLKLYAALIAFSFRNHFGAWRYTLSRMGSYIFFTIIVSEFWRAVIAQGTRSFPFDRNDIVWYCGAGQMVLFVSTRIFARIETDVLNGDIAYHLTRPIDYMELRLTEGVGGLAANLSLFLPVGFALCYFYSGAMPKGSIGYTAYFIVLASLLHMFFQIFVGFCGIWLHEVQLPYRIYQKIMVLLGGLEVPVSVYPLWAQYLSWATPFGLMIMLPCTAIFNPDIGRLFQCALLMTGWVAALFALTLTSYRYAHKTICLNGG